MGIEEDSLRELKTLNQNITALTRSLGKMGENSFSQSTRRDGARTEFDTEKKARRGSRAADSQDKAATSYNAAAKSFLRSSGKLTAQVDDANDDFKTLRESWQEGSEAMFDMKERIDKWGNSTAMLNSQTAKIVAGMSRFQSSVAKTTKAQSLLYSEQLTFIEGFKDFEKVAYFDELSKSLGSLNDVTKKRLKLVDESTGQLRADLDLSDFRKVRSTIGEMESSMKEVLSSTGFKSFAELVDKGSFNKSTPGNDSASINREAVTKIAAILQSRGLLGAVHGSMSVLDNAGNIKSAKELNKIDWEGLAKHVSMTEQSFIRTGKNLDEKVDVFNDKWARMTTSFKNSKGRAAGLDSLKSMAANYLSSGAALSKAKNKIIDAYKEISDFNIAAVPASYMQVNKASVELGLSFKDTVKLMEDNKRILAIYGPEKFTSAMGEMAKTFHKYGYTLEQAASVIGPTIESAITAGINIRDPAQLNTFTDNMMKEFKSISGVVKISAEEFMQLNKELFDSEGAFDIMLGMDTQRRQAYAQDLVQLRDRYALQGLEYKQAQALVEMQQQQQRGSLKDRTTDAAKMMMMAQQAGMSTDDQMEIFRLTSKGRRSQDEQQRLSELAGQANEGLESAINAGYGPSGDGIGGDLLNEYRLQVQPSGQMTQMLKAGSQMQMFNESGAQPTTAEAKKAAEAAVGSENVAKFGDVINKVSSLMNNTLVDAIFASSAALVAFAFQAATTGRLLGKGGIVNGAIDIGKSFFKKGGSAAEGGLATAAEGGLAATGKSGLKSVLGKTGSVLGPALIGYDGISNLNDIEDQRKAGQISDRDAKVKSAGQVGMVAGAGSLGIIGAAAGTVLLPGVGTVIGGALGGWLGGYLGDKGTQYAADKVISDDKTPGQINNQIQAVPGLPANTLPPSISNSGNNSSGSDINTQSQSTLDVQDKDANEQLASILQGINQAVLYLQKLSDNKQIDTSSSPSKNAPQSIPSAYEFTTGRKMA